jgi:glycosyltransferase involved in cell wall biosynthesis
VEEAVLAALVAVRVNSVDAATGMNTDAAGTGRLAVFIHSFDNGGVERMMVNLAGAVAARRMAVDFVVNRARGPYLDSLPAAVRRFDLNADESEVVAAAASYLRKEQPAALLSAKESTHPVAIRARDLAGVATRVFLRIDSSISEQMAHRAWWRRWWVFRQLRRLCRAADGIIAVSEGVADDVASITGCDRRALRVAHNPVVTARTTSLAEVDPGHPWFGTNLPPVVLAAGRFSRAKDFATLLRAFARLRARRRCRLIVLGEGRQRERLERLAAELGVAEDVALPGFVDNPYAYMRRARLFALSSRFGEGSPNVLTEALAIGTPVVSTDCPSGPREILQDGRYGRLVPVGDDAAMAQAMLAAMDEPVDRELLRGAAAPYAVERAAAEYLEVLGLTAPGQGQ